MDVNNRARAALTMAIRHNDLALVFLLAAVVALMIVPMPTPLVDTLIGANMALSFVVLMMSLYVRNVLDFSVFPTLLLFTTLFRVGLNIATTRLILLQADAGEIIFTFGEFALGGNFVVGAVVFVILTLVQFLVVAKGAERVAEVAARFSLDAMPGKQMSIDADLRAGVIDMAEAQRRREKVNRESQMYGAMDGAMKFVKGDSIAGMIVAVVNIVGGVLIGVNQNGMSAMDALGLYGVLTIGDGLVSQIPSLVIAISAGVLITRSEDESDHVAALIGGQILAQPKALLVSAGLVFCFALVPGFPKPQLFALAGALAGLGLMMDKAAKSAAMPDARTQLARTLAPATRKGARKTALDGGSASKQAGGAMQDEFAPPAPIILDISEELGQALDYDSLNQELAGLRRALYLDLGVPFPGIHLRPAPALEGLAYVLYVNEIPLAQSKLEKGMVLVRDSEANLRMLGLDFQTGEGFLPGEPSLWTAEANRSRLEAAGLAFLEHARILAWHLSLLLARHAASFIGMQETKHLLDKMEERAPDLVNEATRALSVQRIADVLQRLVQEQISIRDLRGILEAIIEWSPKEKDIIMLAEYVRGALKRQISYMYSRGRNMLPAILLDPQVEDMIRKAIRQTSAGSFLALEPEVTRQFLEAVTVAAGPYRQHSQKPVLMAGMDIRRYVRKLIEADHYELPVLSYQELTPEITVQPVERVRW